MTTPSSPRPLSVAEELEELEGIDFHDYAAARALVDTNPEALGTVLTTYGFADAAAWRIADEAWRARFAAIPRLGRSFMMFYDDHVERLRPPPEPAVAPNPPAEALETPSDPATPAAPPVALATPSYLRAALTPAIGPLSEAVDVDETAPVVGPTAAALPFAPSSEPRPPPRSEPAPPSDAKPGKTLPQEDVTLPPNVGAQGPDLPFIQALRKEAALLAEAAKGLGTAPTEVLTIPVRPTSTRIDTEETLQPVRRVKNPTLPFTPPSDRAPPVASPRPTTTPNEAAHALPVNVDETAFVSRDLVLGPATPFEAQKEPATDPTPQSSPPPSFPLYQYAAFLGELSRNPSRAAEVRAKYNIADEASQRAIGAQFAKAFDRDPSLRVTFDALVAKARSGR